MAARPIRLLRTIITLTLLLALTLPLGFAPRPAAAAGQTLVLVGGGLADNNAAVYDRIVQLAGGRGVARIGVITAASIPESQDPDAGTADAANSRANGEYYANLFKTTYGAADAQWIPIDLDRISNNASPAVISQINGMTGFFFGGGDQSRLITTFMTASRADSPALAAIRAKFQGGTVVAGTSAGTAIQSSGVMITGGESWDGVVYGAYSSPSDSYPTDLTYDQQGGFGFFTHGLLDTHFAERGRQGRIIRLAADTGRTMAYGVDENTALVVLNANTSNAEMEVIGQYGVGIFDLSSATVGTGSAWSITNVKASYLTSGDRFYPGTKAFSFASWKTALAGREYYSSAMSPSGDIFSSPNNYGPLGRRKPREFVIVSTDLFDSRVSSTYGRTYDRQPQYEVRFTKSSALGSAGYLGTSGGLRFYAYKNLKVDILKYR